MPNIDYPTCVNRNRMKLNRSYNKYNLSAEYCWEETFDPEYKQTKYIARNTNYPFCVNHGRMKLNRQYNEANLCAMLRKN